MKFYSKAQLWDTARQYEIVIVSWFILGVVVVLTLVFLMPSVSAGFTIKRQTKELAATLSLLQKKDTTLQSIDPVRYKQLYGKIRRVLPESKDIASIFTTIDMLQQTTGVSFNRTDFQFGVVSTQSAKAQKKHPSGAFTLPVQFETIGDRSQTAQLLDSLQSYKSRLIAVKNIEWRFSEEGTVRTLISGEAYYYPTPTTIGSVETPLPQLIADGEDLLRTIDERIVAGETEELGETETPIGKTDLFL